MAFPTFDERVVAIVRQNTAHNMRLRVNPLNTDRDLETDPKKIAKRLLRRMMGRKRRTQVNRRKLCRQNPSLLRGVYKAHKTR